MQNTDKSSGGRTRLLKARAAAAGPLPTGSIDQSEQILVRFGNQPLTYQTPTGDIITESCCVTDCAPPVVGSLGISEAQGPQPPYDASYNVFFDISWSPFPGATSYSLTTDVSGAYLFVYTPGNTTAQLYIVEVNSVFNITVTGTNDCGSVDVSGTAFAPCFLAGSPVTMADGTTKFIEDVVVGDMVLGAFGEHNPVLALHRPLLGDATMTRINNEHSTTSHHPHVGADRRFFSNDLERVNKYTYGRHHPVINAAGQTEMRFLHGLNPERLYQLVQGVALKTVDGSRTVTALETYSMSPETQLYNLVVGGSHTYHVEGYAVTGWPREDDWDYDAWTSK
jgi:hypothetical protein